MVSNLLNRSLIYILMILDNITVVMLFSMRIVCNVITFFYLRYYEIYSAKLRRERNMVTNTR